MYKAETVFRSLPLFQKTEGVRTNLMNIEYRILNNEPQNIEYRTAEYRRERDSDLDKSLIGFVVWLVPKRQLGNVSSPMKPELPGRRVPKLALMNQL
jgi:hypothetical protein